MHGDFHWKGVWDKGKGEMYVYDYVQWGCEINAALCEQFGGKFLLLRKIYVVIICIIYSAYRGLYVFSNSIFKTSFQPAFWVFLLVHH